jgi:hypothetical protein
LCKEGVIRLILAKRHQYVPCLLSGSLCPSGIASKALSESQDHAIRGLVNLRSELELSQSGSLQTDGLTVISFKSQLSRFDY